MRVNPRVFLLATIAVGSALTAMAQGEEIASVEQGSVASIGSETGSVIVIRGGSTYTLSPGDALFEGDRVQTRANGAATISAYGCSQTLEASSSIVLDGDFCEAAPITLADAETVEGAEGGGVGAAGFIIGGLAAAGGVAAAGGGGGGDDGGTPTSP